MNPESRLDALFTQAKDGSGLQDRVNALREIHDVLLCQPQGHLPRDLQIHALDSVLELQGDSSFLIRRQVALLSSSLCLSIHPIDPISFEKLFSCLMLFLEDSKPAVVQAVISKNIEFQRFAAEKKREPEFSKLVNNLRDRSVSKYDTATDDGIRNRIIHLLEFLVLLYSSGVTSRDLFISGQDLDVLKHLSGLIGNRKSTASNISAIVNSLMAIARKRPQHITECITPLLSLQRMRKPINIPESQWNRVLYTLKFSLAFLSEFKAASRFKDPISASLQRISAMLRTIRQKLRAQSILGDVSVEATGKVKQLKSISGINPVFYESLLKLSPYQASELAIQTLDLFIVPDLQKASELIQDHQKNSSVSSISERKNLLFSELPGLNSVSSLVEGLLGNLYSQSVQDPRLRSKAKKAAASESRLLKDRIETALKDQRTEILRQLRRSFVPELSLPTIDEKERSFLQAICLKRLFYPKSLVPLRASGSSSIYEASLARVLLLLNIDNIDNEIIIDQVVGEIGEEKLSMFLRLLYLLFVQLESGDETARQMYEDCTLAVFKALSESQSSLTSTFVSQLPSISSSLHDSILSLCHSSSTLDTRHLQRMEAALAEDHLSESRLSAKEGTVYGKAQLGLGTVNTIILTRPKDRETYLELILNFCFIQNPVLRVLSQRVVASSLIPEAFLFRRIKEFSYSSAEEACTKTVDSLTLDRIRFFVRVATFDPSLLPSLVNLYCIAGEIPRQMILDSIGSLITLLGMDSPHLLTVLSDSRPGCEVLHLNIVNILTRDQIPSPALVRSVLEIFDKTLDPRFLVPILPGLKRQQMLPALPKIIQLSTELVSDAIGKIVNQCGEVFSSTELLVRLVTLAPTAKHPLSRPVTNAISLFFKEPQVAQSKVLAAALQQLIELTPLPVLLMKTIRQTLQVCSSLNMFVMGLLNRLVGKKIWKVPKLWSGFVKCCLETAPDSYPVLLRLPRRPFRSLLREHPELTYPLYMCIQSKVYIVPRDLRNIVFDHMYELQQQAN